jgi:hypothetical protein
MFARNDIYFRLHLLLIIIHITYISLSLRRTSAPINLTSVLGVLETQETSCIVITGLLERDSFDLLFPEIDKPWVIHLRKNCCCSRNLCTWRPNTVYKNRRVRRHQAAGGDVGQSSPLSLCPAPSLADLSERPAAGSHLLKCPSSHGIHLRELPRRRATASRSHSSSHELQGARHGGGRAASLGFAFLLGSGCGCCYLFK